MELRHGKDSTDNDQFSITETFISGVVVFIVLLVSMTEQKHIGRMGEEHAARYLESNGYEIAERNWKFRRYEIDIIAWLNDLLVIVEVKTRAGSYYRPERYVSIEQWRSIAFATSKYMTMVGHEWEVRFDIVSVSMKDDTPDVKHYPDVFFPGR